MDKAIAAGIPDGKAIPARTARLKIGDIDMKQEIPENAKAAVFTVRLKAGKARLETRLVDSENNELCSAYYVYVKRIQ